MLLMIIANIEYSCTSV